MGSARVGLTMGGLGTVIILIEALMKPIDSSVLFWSGFGLLLFGLLLTLSNIKGEDRIWPWPFHWIMNSQFLLAMMLIIGRPTRFEMGAMGLVAALGGLAATRLTRRWEGRSRHTD